MKKLLDEILLTEYFMIEGVLGRHMPERQKVLAALLDAYLVPDEDRADLQAAICDEKANEIITEQDFYQYCRVKKYANLSAIDLSVNERSDEVIAVKGNALSILREAKLITERESTRASVYKMLSACADAGVVYALRMLGFLHYEGLFFEANHTVGRRYLLKAAEWNDLTALLVLLMHGEGDRGELMFRISTSLKGTPFSDLCDRASNAYKGETRSVPEVRLLEKAFKLGVLQRECYSSQYARVIFGCALSYNDKEKLVLSGNKDAVAEASNLPLKLPKSGYSAINVKLDDICGERDEEKKKVLAGLRGGVLRTYGDYRPLCLCCDSSFLLRSYAAQIEKIGEGVHKIELSGMGEYDIEPTASNVFLRYVDEDDPNVLLLFVTGNIKESVLNVAKGFLQTENRRNFRLSKPSVTLDLSGVLPILFCDKENLRYVKDYCDVVYLAPVKEEEQNDWIEGIVCRLENDFNLRNITVLPQALERLGAINLDRAADVLTKAVRDNQTGGELIIDCDMIDSYIGASYSNKKGYGFGGVGHEGK